MPTQDEGLFVKFEVMSIKEINNTMSTCRILDDAELEIQSHNKETTRQWLPETQNTTRPFNQGFIKTHAFPKAFHGRNYIEDFPVLTEKTSTVTVVATSNAWTTSSLLEKVKTILSVPLDTGERRAPPYEPKTPPYG